MEAQKVQEHFARQADEYEQLMARLVPHYHEQHLIMEKLIPFESEQRLKMLDLGAGPGVLAEVVLKNFSKAEVVVFDLTEKMLEACKKRLAPFQDRLTVVQGDFKTDSLGTGYDLVMAGLSLQHLDHAERRDIYKDIYNSLKPGGMYLAREIVVDPSTYVTDWHYRLWREFMRTQGEDDALWYEKHRAKDHPATIEQNLSWLSEAGFVHAVCHWRYFNFAILTAQKN